MPDETDYTHKVRLHRLGISEFTNKVWCLIYSMRENGITGDDPWWGEDFLGVERMLNEMGLNTNPTLGALTYEERKRLFVLSGIPRRSHDEEVEYEELKARAEAEPTETDLDDDDK